MATPLPANVTRLTLDAPGGTAEAYLATPSGIPKAGIVLFMDAFGLRPRIAEMSARIASWGYGVLAPHIFYRWGRAADLSPPGPLLTPEARAAFLTPAVAERISGYSTDYGRQDNQLWVETLKHEFGESPIGTTGYCFGARLATKFAGEYPQRVLAAGGWHAGGLVTDAPDSPHRSIASAKAEFHYAHADNDPTMTPENVAELGDALGSSGVTYRNEVFEGALHGYTMSDTSSYSAEHEARHWSALESLLGRAL